MVRVGKIILILCLGIIFNIKLVFAKTVVNLYTTSNYIADSTILSYEKSCGCELFINYFSDPLEMMAKIAAGASGYDVIIGTGYAVEDLYKIGKFTDLNLHKIQGLNNLESNFTHLAFDPHNKFSIPYAYTVTVAGYNKTKLDKLGIIPDTWAVFFDEKYLKKLQGHVTVFDSQRNVYAAALLYLGKDPNSPNKADLAMARKVIEKASHYWIRYDSTTYYRSLLSGDVWLAMSYSNDLFNTLQDAKKSKLPYQISGMLQKEGNMIELDNMVIPKDSKNKDLAYQFISHALLPKSSYALSEDTGSSVPNYNAIKMLSKSITNYNWIYPKPNQKIYNFTSYPPKIRVMVNEDWLEIKMDKSCNI